MSATAAVRIARRAATIAAGPYRPIRAFHRPGRSTKALYRTQVSWPELDGPQAPAREELFGASAHIGEREKNLYVAEQTLVMTDGDINVRVWRYPHDPWLPMLPQVCYPDIVGRIERLLAGNAGAWRNVLVMFMDEEGYESIKPGDFGPDGRLLVERRAALAGRPRDGSPGA